MQKLRYRINVCTLLLAGACTLGGASLQPCRAQEADQSEKAQIVAEINSRKITKSELRDALRRHVGTELGYFGPEDKHPLLKGVLARMVERELLLQAAVKKGVTVKQPEFEKFLSDLKQQLPKGQTLEDKIVRDGLDQEQFMQGLREDLLITKYLEQTVYSAAAVSDGDIERALESEKSQLTVPVEVRVRHIMLLVPPNADEDEINTITKQMEAIRNQAVLPGADFVGLAKQYSQGPHSARGGDLGYLTANQIDSAFAEAAFSLPQGEISEIIRTKTGMHLLRVEGRRGGEALPADEARETVRKKLLSDRKQQQLRQHLKQLAQSNQVIVYLR